MTQHETLIKQNPAPSLQDQAAKLSAHAAGYSSHRTIEMGLRHGIFGALQGRPKGLTPQELAKAAGLDPFYSAVWCRAAYGAEVLETDGEGRYSLAPHIDSLLLDRDSPAFSAGVFLGLEQPEVFDLFSQNFASGKRIWWDECSPEWIQSVSATGQAFNNRFIPGALSQVPGLESRLAQGVRALELACGTGIGLVKLKKAFPKTALVGLDGDAYSLELARKTLADAGVQDEVELTRSTLEALDRREEFDLVTINISMHECRDIEKVTENVRRALRPGGTFVISDFPFPDEPEGLRTVPGRIMAGIQFFEAQIDDQLLPTGAYEELLERHGFRNVGSFDVTPVHVVVHGTK